MRTGEVLLFELHHAWASSASRRVRLFMAEKGIAYESRLVRIGAFSSVHQAKRGWWSIVRASPTLTRLPALVVPVRSLRTGRRYYRLQMGTTSQAHSAVLCQRMRMVGEPCVVIGAVAGK